MHHQTSSHHSKSRAPKILYPEYDPLCTGLCGARKCCTLPFIAPRHTFCACLLLVSDVLARIFPINFAYPASPIPTNALHDGTAESAGADALRESHALTWVRACTPESPTAPSLPSRSRQPPCRWCRCAHQLPPEGATPIGHREVGREGRREGAGGEGVRCQPIA